MKYNNEAKRVAAMAAMLAAAPRPPSTLVHQRSPQRSPPRPQQRSLNNTLQALRQAILAQKRQRLLNQQTREAQLLALHLPSVPQTRVYRTS